MIDSLAVRIEELRKQPEESDPHHSAKLVARKVVTKASSCELGGPMRFDDLSDTYQTLVVTFLEEFIKQESDKGFIPYGQRLRTALRCTESRVGKPRPDNHQCLTPATYNDGVLWVMDAVQQVVRELKPHCCMSGDAQEVEAQQIQFRDRRARRVATEHRNGRRNNNPPRR